MFKTVSVIFLNSNVKATNELDLFECVEIYFFIRNDIEKIRNKLSDILKTEEIKEASLFDEYDKENGYIEEDTEDDIYTNIENLNNTIVRYCIDVLKENYSSTMEIELYTFLDFLKFDMKKREEEQKENERAGGEI